MCPHSSRICSATKPGASWRRSPSWRARGPTRRPRALGHYLWFYAARGHWLAAAGDTSGARAAFVHALTLDATEPVRRRLRQRLAGVGA
jgi:hypothetical protein